MEVVFLSRVVVDRCLVSLRFSHVDQRGSSFVDPAALRTSSKRRRIPHGICVKPSSKNRSRPPDLVDSLRHGPLLLHRSIWYQIRLKVLTTLNTRPPNRNLYRTGAVVAVGGNLTAILFGAGNLSDEQSTILPSCISWNFSMVWCCWAWPITILKACSLAIIEYGQYVTLVLRVNPPSDKLAPPSVNPRRDICTSTSGVSFMSVLQEEPGECGGSTISAVLGKSLSSLNSSSTSSMERQPPLSCALNQQSTSLNPSRIRCV